MKQTLTINKVDFKVGFSLRAIKLFEEMAGKSIQQQTGTWDNTIFFYCTLKALNENFEMTFDEFIDYLDNNTSLLIDWQTLNNAEVEADENTTATNDKKKQNTLFTLWMLSLLLLVCMAAAPIIFGIGLVPMSLWGITKLITSIGKKPKP